MMKRTISFFSTIILIVFTSTLFNSCAKESLNETVLESHFSQVTKNSIQNSDYIYFVPAKVWIQRQEDPYDIANIREIAQEQNEESEILPTHYAIKFFPRNEIELNDIILMNDVVLSYIPFGYTYVTEEQTVGLDCDNIAENQLYYGETRYCVYRETGSIPEPLPVLYATWPVTKAIPEKYDYEIAYSACLPCNDCHREENHGAQIANNLRGSSYRTISAFILDYDSLLNKYVPVKNLRMRLTYGLSTMETYTSSSGYFSFTGTINDDASLSIVYENSQWRLTNSSLFTYVVSKGKVSDRWGPNGGSTTMRTDTESQVLHRAAEFFYNGNHEIETPASNYSIRINMVTDETCFITSGIIYPWIKIQLASYKDDPDYVNYLLHELGHFNHYQYAGQSNFSNLPRLVKDSFADYISWYLSNSYYLSLNNGIYGSNWDFDVVRGDQWWYNTSAEPGLFYSPLFVDLIDDFDQSTQSNIHTYNTDTVTGITHDQIADIVTNVGTWSGIRTNIQDCICEHHSISTSIVYLAPYDAYFAAQ